MQFSTTQKHRLYTELGKLIGAGFSIDKAAETMLHQRPGAVQRRFLKGVRKGLAAHQTIAEAVAGTGVTLSPLEISLIDAGEKGGRLGEACDHLADYFLMIQQARRRFWTSLIYPAILLHFGILLPAIPRAFLANDPSVAVRIILWKLGFVYVVCGILAIAAVWLSKAGRTNAIADGTLRMIPLAGKARRSLALGRFCKVFQIHLLAALPISTGLRAAGAASQSGVVRAGSSRAAEAIEGGDSLANALVGEGGFPPDFRGAMSTAEASGTLDVDLNRWAKIYDETAARTLDAASGWFPKALYLLIVFYVAWEVLGIGLGYVNAVEGYLEEP